MPNSKSNNTELATGFTVDDCRTAFSTQNRAVIADAIQRRFKERYINPVTTGEKHGFAIMAIACLMVESLESFRQGWENTNNRSEAALCYFFDGHAEFDSFRSHFAQFYKHVRCGILHQAETTGGWRVIRSGPLFDAASLTINATCFLKYLENAIDNLCESLKSADWYSTEWKNVRKKMKALCNNCDR